MTLMKIVISIVVMAVGIVFFTLYKNDANLFQPPGFGKRLAIFLTTNAAEIKHDHPFEELRTPVYELDAETLYKRVTLAASQLGWKVLATDIENQNANFVAHSPVFLFEDDVYVQVQFIDMNRSSLFVQSSSRKGRADMAANSSHIQALIRKLNN